MSSTRLPGKVLMEIGGETMLARVVRRTRMATLLNEVIVATTDQPADKAIVAECERLEARVSRGSEQDVLDRYFQAACATRADIIVRITSDCPLIDPEIIDQVIDLFLKERPDYASNALLRTYPRGLDTEVMSHQALALAWRKAKEPYQRVHVTPYLYEHPKQFRLLSVTGPTDYSYYRWTVDTQEDLKFVRALYECFDNKHSFHWKEALSVLKLEPSLTDLNRHIQQKPLKQC